MHSRFLALTLLMISAVPGCGGGDQSTAGGAGDPGSGGNATTPSGSGGSGPVAGSGGGVGSGGASQPAGTGGATVTPPATMDASVDQTDDAKATGPADAGMVAIDASASGPYTCNLIIGILTTSEWFGNFEKIVGSARWEIKFADSAHIEKWADPNNGVWALPITSPCTENAMAPDRVVFMGVNYDYATVELFLPKYIAVLNNIKVKFPSVKRLDVMTYTRGPGNKECVGANRSNDSYIKPAQDEAISMFAAMYPGFVFPAPKWEVQSCADFTLCPHLTGTANATIAMNARGHDARVGDVDCDGDLDIAGKPWGEGEGEPRDHIYLQNMTVENGGKAVFVRPAGEVWAKTQTRKFCP